MPGFHMHDVYCFVHTLNRQIFAAKNIFVVSPNNKIKHVKLLTDFAKTLSFGRKSSFHDYFVVSSHNERLRILVVVSSRHTDLPSYFCQLSRFDQLWMALHLAQSTGRLSAEYLQLAAFQIDLYLQRNHECVCVTVKLSQLQSSYSVTLKQPGYATYQQLHKTIQAPSALQHSTACSIHQFLRHSRAFGTLALSFEGGEDSPLPPMQKKTDQACVTGDEYRPSISC